jgi:hypothetical protein
MINRLNSSDWSMKARTEKSTEYFGKNSFGGMIKALCKGIF